MLGDFGGVSLLSRSAIQDPDVPLSLKGHTSSRPNPFNAYICIMYTNEHAGAPKGRAGFPCHKSYMYSRKREKEEEEKRGQRNRFITKWQHLGLQESPSSLIL